jgi:hypothetical protein
MGRERRRPRKEIIITIKRQINSNVTSRQKKNDGPGRGRDGEACKTCPLARLRRRLFQHV